MMRNHSQRGVALITVMLIVALGVLTVAAVLASSRVAMHRAGNLRDSETEWWYAMGVESWVKSILERDIEDNKFDGMTDAWAKPVDYLPVDYGSIRGGIVDQQGLFNLNNFAIVDTPAKTGTAAKNQYALYVAQFERLFQNIEGVDVAAARPLAAAIHDWIDKDDQQGGSDGAEDAEYLTHDPPYRAGNQLLASVSEVLAIKGMTPQLYRALAPYITVLPNYPTSININTAPEAVLRSLVTQPSDEAVRFFEDRTKNPKEKQQDAALLFPAAKGAPPVDVKSNFFMLRAEVFIGSGRLALYSFFYRPDQGAPILLGRSLDSP